MSENGRPGSWSMTVESSCATAPTGRWTATGSSGATNQRCTPDGWWRYAVTPRRDGHPVRQVGDEFLRGGLGHHDDRVAVDRRIAIEEPAEVFDVADAHRAAIELCLVDDTGVQQAAAQRGVGDALGVVDDAVVEVREHLGVRLEDDLSGERPLAGIVQRQPDRLRSVDDERRRGRLRP